MKPFLYFRKFRSVDNSRDPKRLDSDKTGLYRVLENVDVDDEMMIHIKKGHVLLTSLTDPHSLWSNGKFCFVMDGTNFYRVWEDYSLTLLISGITNGMMDYVDRGDGVIYFTNGYIIGYFDGGAVYPFPAVTQHRKAPMVGGTLIDYFNSRLYVANDDKIYYSEAGQPMVRDEEHGFWIMGDRITLFEAIGDGIFVGVGDKVIFLGGDGFGLDPPNPRMIKVTDDPVIFRSGFKVPGVEYKKGITGTVAVWLSGSGAYMGMPGGEVRISTGSNFFVEGIYKGAGIFRDDSGWEMCTWAYEYEQGYEPTEIKITVPIPAVSLISTGAYTLSILVPAPEIAFSSTIP